MALLVNIFVRPRLSRLRGLVVASTLAAFVAPMPAAAQDPPRIPFFVIDLHGTTTRFPDDPILAASRGINQAELPGRGLGGAIAAHIYPFRFRAVTFGIGGRVATARASRDPGAEAQTPALRAVTERFTYLGPQLSLNFGTGSGWSYLSGGIATSTWSVVPQGLPPSPADEEGLKTIDYGGGARWFAKPHLAFSFDLRFYAINPSTPVGGRPGSPRTTLFVVGAGVSIK
jgi:hypothetical protein